MVQAVAREQAGGRRDDALWHENERRKAENTALGQAWAAAADLSEAKQRHWAGSGWAMGLSLSPSVTLCAIGLPLGAVPRRAMVGRWVQERAARAGRLLVGLALACQARVRVLCLDAIFLHRAPVLMAIAPHSMAWMAGQRGPDRSGESWGTVLTHWPCLAPVIADGGQGLERGVKLAHAARGTPGKAAQTVAKQAMTMGLDGLHTQRERERVIQRQGRDPRGVSGGAGRAWRKAERRVEQAGHAQEAVPQMATALSWCEAQGRLSCRQTAQAQRDAASQQLQGACWSKGKRLWSDERTLSPLDRLRDHLAAAVSAPGLRDAFTRLWYVNVQMPQAQGDAGWRLRPLVVIEQMLCQRWWAQWQRA